MNRFSDRRREEEEERERRVLPAGCYLLLVGSSICVSLSFPFSPFFFSFKKVFCLFPESSHHACSWTGAEAVARQRLAHCFSCQSSVVSSAEKRRSCLRVFFRVETFYRLRPPPTEVAEMVFDDDDDRRERRRRRREGVRGGGLGFGSGSGGANAGANGRALGRAGSGRGSPGVLPS